MTHPNVTETVREAANLLQTALKADFLGSREDRGEMTFWVLPASWLQAAATLREAGFHDLSDLTAVDYLDREPRFDVMAILRCTETHQYLRLKTILEEQQTLSTLTSIWPGANWLEREVYDLFGIEFEQHPDLRRILLPKDYNGFPLRKDFPVTGPASSLFR